MGTKVNMVFSAIELFEVVILQKKNMIFFE